MQIQITIGGLGLQIPKTGLGVNISSGAYISFRRTNKSKPFLVLVIGDRWSLGSNSGTI